VQAEDAKFAKQSGFIIDPAVDAKSGKPEGVEAVELKDWKPAANR